MGLTFLTATTNVLYRDTTQISEFLIFVWFYVSPVLYDMDVVRENLSENLHWLYYINPMVGITEWYRYSLLSASQIPSDWYTQTILYQVIPLSALISFFMFFVGFYSLKKLETRAVDQM
jgi:ABC-type polysaccharide/polyol phosphate export permease